MQHTVWCKASCTYTNQIIAVLIKKWKELLNCLCSMNHQCKVVLQRWRTEWQCMHNASCVCNSLFLQQSSQPTHLAVERNIMLDGEDISKQNPTGLAGRRLTGLAWWSINNLHSVSVCILVIWWGIQTGHMRTHSGVHPLHKGTTIQTIIHAHTRYIHTD